MSPFSVRRMVLTPFASNCYIVRREPEEGGGDKGPKPVLIIDPGGEAEKILCALRSEQEYPAALLATHGHLDHIGAAASLGENFPDAPLLIHEEDAPLLAYLPQQCRQFGLPILPVPRVTQTLSDRQRLRFGPYEAQVLHTPGHSPGSACFLVAGMVFTGDTLFAGGIGRTDLPGGDFPTLMKSIREKLLTLPADLEIRPGHGEITTVEEEKQNNPFLKEG